jgi:hypothetical protein
MALDKANAAASVAGSEVKVANFARQGSSAAERTFLLSRNEFAGPLARTMVLCEQHALRSFNLVLALFLFPFAAEIATIWRMAFATLRRRAGSS